MLPHPSLFLLQNKPEDGKSLVGKKPAEICQEGVARTFQNIRLFTQMSVLDNVKAALHNSIKYNLATSFLHPA